MTSDDARTPNPTSPYADAGAHAATPPAPASPPQPAPAGPPYGGQPYPGQPAYNPYAPMVTPGAAPAPRHIDLASAHKPASQRSFGRLLHTELRKLIDTRSGLWLLIAMGLLAVLLTVGNALIMGYVGRPGGPMEGMADLHLAGVASSGASIMATFIAILGILTITSEWSQRTTLTTFALEPRRGRVLAAKVAAVLLVSLVLFLISFPLAAGAMAIAHSAFHVPVSYGITAAEVTGFGLTMLLSGPIFGIALGLLWLNSPGAIVTYLALPLLLQFLGLIPLVWHPFEKAVKWLSPTEAQAPFLVHWHLSDLGPLATTTLLWMALPAAIGTWRWLRRECK